MDKEQTADPKYVQGFNEGYLIARHLPELANDLSKVKSEQPRMEGFRDGREQFILDKSRNREPGWLKTVSDKMYERPPVPSKGDKDLDIDR